MSTISAEKYITAAQIKAIKAAQRRRGLSDEEYYHLLQEMFEVNTCKILSRRQANELLHRLGVPLRQPPGTKQSRPKRPRESLPAGVTRMATPHQRDLIAAMVREITWREADGFARWLRRYHQLERVATAAQAARVIEGLKGLKKHNGGGG